MEEAPQRLSIVIPALDEEDAIGDTLRRCREARSHICDKTPVREVELLVVSDGSTDRTEEIARGFEDVAVIAFDRNRGYGAAIRCGFRHARGDLLGFLDADGTCDPYFFADLVNALVAERADIALGSRLAPGSEMPWLRAVGNTLFAWMLGLLARQAVGDTASGMRVLRRASLPDLEPLPDGLHYTPAMSARVLLEGKLRMIELPMPYAERVGRSKLHAVRDGVRFLTTIFQAAMCYRPARPLLLAAAGAGIAAFAVGIGPTVFWLRYARLEDWMIYRILLASLLATVLAVLVFAAVVADRIAAVAHGRPPSGSGFTGAVARGFTRRARRVGGTLLVAAAVATSWPGIVEYATSGEVYMHWSRAVLSSLLLMNAVLLASTTFLLNMMELIQARRAGPATDPPPDRIRPARGAST